MSAPIKDSTDQTGSFKSLAVILALFVMVGVGVWYAWTLVPNASNNPQQQTQPQVQGTAVQEPEYVPPEESTNPQAPSSDQETDSYVVTKVSDGDTIKVDVRGKTETIRLIGVDTPETKDPRKPVQCFGVQAAQYTSLQLLGKKVRLESDDTQQDRDKYGRMLRYVYINEVLFNETLVREGYAYEYTYKTPYLYQNEFKQAELQAKTSKAGLWNPAVCQQ